MKKHKQTAKPVSDQSNFKHSIKVTMKFILKKLKKYSGVLTLALGIGAPLTFSFYYIYFDITVKTETTIINIQNVENYYNINQ